VDNQQMSLFPDDYPRRLVRFWKAVQRWRNTGIARAPTREELAAKCEPQIAPRTLDHDRHDFRGRVGHWPLQPNDRPPWEIAADNNGLEPSDEPTAEPLQFNVVQDEIHHLYHVRMPALDEHGNPVVVMQSYDSLTNRLVETVIERFHGTAAVVAGIFVFGVLDWLSDGKFDGVVCLLGLMGCPPTT